MCQMIRFRVLVARLTLELLWACSAMSDSSWHSFTGSSIGQLYRYQQRPTEASLYIPRICLCTHCLQLSWDENEYYQVLYWLLRIQRPTDIVVVAGDFDAQLGYLAEMELTSKTHFLFQPFAPTTVIVASKFVLSVGCFWKTLIFVQKAISPHFALSFAFMVLDSDWPRCHRSSMAWVSWGLSVTPVLTRGLGSCFGPYSPLCSFRSVVAPTPKP